MADGQRIALVGGGLVGALASVFLAKRGYPVTVYERGEDIRKSDRTAGRSINLVLTRRGIHALRRVGLHEQAMKLTVPVMGRMMHAVDGELSYQPYGKDDSECNYSISRRGLNQFLVSAAIEHGVDFAFERKLIGADFERGRLEFADRSTAARVEIDAPLVFGADGGGSALRSQMTRLPGFTESIEMLGHGYKELLIPVEQGKNLELNALHIWPRGDIMLMALPNLDRSFTVTLYLPDSGSFSFESLDAPAKVESFFRGQFPDAVPLIPDLAESFFDNPTGQLGTVRCSPWHWRDQALLIGDAAHGIVPFFGQGMNCGFEDCAVLDDLLDGHEDAAWGPVFEEFSRRRKPDADAIADMALENFVEMRDKVGDASFLLRKQVEHRLEQEIPTEYRSRYSMVMYSLIPYRTAFEAGLRQESILAELCEGLSSRDDLDLDQARRLIREQLTPFLESRSVRLDY